MHGGVAAAGNLRTRSEMVQSEKGECGASLIVSLEQVEGINAAEGDGKARPALRAGMAIPICKEGAITRARV